MSTSPESLVKEDPGTRLFRFPLGSGEVLLKRYDYPNLFLRLRARLFPSRACREFRVLEELRRREVPTLTPVAYGELDGWLLRRTSYLATVFVEDAVTLEAHLDSWPRRAERDRVLEAVARLVRRMHERGFAHGSLFPRNVLLTEDGNPIVFDAPFGRFLDGTVPEGARADDLACLFRFAHPWLTSGEKARFLRIYLGRSHGEGLGDAGKSLARRVLASAAFTRSVRRKLAFHWRRWTGRPQPSGVHPPRPVEE